MFAWMAEPKVNWTASLRGPIDGAAERRREERRFLKLPIEVRVPSGVTYTGLSRDLSRTSLGAVVSARLEVGQQVWVTFRYPEAGKEPVRVELQATVRQCLGFRYGFEFVAPLDIDLGR